MAITEGFRPLSLHHLPSSSAPRKICICAVLHNDVWALGLEPFFQGSELDPRDASIAQTRQFCVEGLEATWGVPCQVAHRNRPSHDNSTEL